MNRFHKVYPNSGGGKVEKPGRVASAKVRDNTISNSRTFHTEWRGDIARLHNAIHHTQQNNLLSPSVEEDKD